MIRYAEAATMVTLKPKNVPVKPIHVQIEPTDACNQDCSFCAHSEVIDDPKIMSLETFQKIIDDIEPKKVTLSGYGEPMINKALPEMIAYAKAKGASVNTTSNMTLLRSEKKAQALIESGLDLINASLDAATAETYKMVRGEDYFDRIINGVRLLIHTKEVLKSKSPNVRVSFVINKANLHELPDFVRMAHDLKVDVVYFQMLQLTAIEERHDRLIAGVPYDEFEAALKEGERIARQLGVKTNLSSLISELPDYWCKYDPGEMSHKKCMLPWFSMYITVNGTVRPCCAFAPVKVNMGGSILEKPFEEVWNSGQYQGFRKALKAGKRPTKVCQECVPENMMDIARRVPYSPGFFLK